MVRVDNSCSSACGFESQHHILNGHDIFHIYFDVKIALFV